MSKFVDAYDKANGRKHRIPAHWLTHPILSKPFRKTPKQRGADGEQAESATPATDVVTATPATTETPATGAKE